MANLLVFKSILFIVEVKRDGMAMYKSIALFSFLFAFANASQGGLNINVRPTASGQYDILVDGEVWFPGSAHAVGLHNHPDLQVIKETKKSLLGAWRFF